MNMEISKDGIGDVSSTARGSGARYNSGKIAMEYVPAGVVADLSTPRVETENASWRAGQVLLSVGQFEIDKNPDHLRSAFFWLTTADQTWKDAWGPTVEQFQFGAEKYAPFNWAKGMAWSVPLACIKRHALAIIDGELTDPESGVSHFGAIGCNLVMLAFYVRHYPDMDDIPDLVVEGAAEDSEPARDESPRSDDGEFEWSPRFSPAYMALLLSPNIAPKKKAGYLTCAFTWGDAPQGHTYWERIKSDLKSGELDDLPEEAKAFLWRWVEESLPDDFEAPVGLYTAHVEDLLGESSASPEHDLTCAFVWRESPQGYDYWRAIRSDLAAGEEIPDSARDYLAASLLKYRLTNG